MYFLLLFSSGTSEWLAEQCGHDCFCFKGAKIGKMCPVEDFSLANFVCLNKQNKQILFAFMTE